MKTVSFPLVCASLLVLSTLIPGTALSTTAARTLWEIGQYDKNNSEFALAPKDHSKLVDDGFFVVGQSKTGVDWPYVHPGPVDTWAGGRSHTFTILFGLSRIAPQGTAQLVLNVLDTQASIPPILRVSVNGKHQEKQLPKGAGDASIYGDPSKGKPTQWIIDIPAGDLRAGENEIALTTVSGSWFLYDSIRFEAPTGTELGFVKPQTKLTTIVIPPYWLNKPDGPIQPLQLNIHHTGPETPGTVVIGRFRQELQIKQGAQTVSLDLPASEEISQTELRLTLGDTLIKTNISIRPPGIREMWILPHSHVDIGYTHQQEEVVQAQISHLRKALELAKASAGQPEGMRFKWNPEAVWVVDHYLNRATKSEQQEFIKAVQDGVIGVEGLYANMLTALCRPEELAQCLGFAARVSNLTGRTVRAATICDVPGYTWGILPMMAQTGVRYFAIGPNFQDRVGTIHIWDDKPFYWQSQSGMERVLCWVVDNYHHLGDLEQHVLGQISRQSQGKFPYDLSFLLWVGAWPSGAVDNAPPDDNLVKKVVAWNAKYAAPRVKIGLTADFFETFEKKYGSKLPQFAGDLTPYWEDGAASTSRETAMNRASADRLSQASTLFAMRQPGGYSQEKFNEAWKNVLLYSEHTWGAWCSISQPDDPFTINQWKTKQAFALEADRLSNELLSQALPTVSGNTPDLQVFNTTQWARDGLAVVPEQLAGAEVLGVTDVRGRHLPAQRLASGELAFLASDVPAFGARSFRLSTSKGGWRGSAVAKGHVLENGILRVEVDSITGAIKSLQHNRMRHEFVDSEAPVGINDFRYVLAEDAKGAKGNSPVRISILEKGPLRAALRIESEAPGCRNLVREVRLSHGHDYLEIVNNVDRLPVREKDAVHFGFGFNVPAGVVRMETPWSVLRPNVDQLPGANRNWFTVQRWVDISSESFGITWAPMDAPLLQLGGITANLLGSVEFRRWMTRANESPVIYSWAQNNHWHTNYKVDQPGVTTFRYLIRPHMGGYSAAESAKFGHETTRPLLVASGSSAPAKPLLEVSSDDVTVETIKVSDDGHALVMRLFGAAARPVDVKLKWNSVKPESVWLSDLTEKPRTQIRSVIQVPAYGVVTIRAELRNPDIATR